uniref:GA module-containing protein n=1 Tax=Staphylococcus pasteuri TaxID=45972 RepID=UPI0012B9AA2F
YSEGERTKEEAYTNGVSEGNGILSKDEGRNGDITEVEAGLNEVRSGKNGLKGEEKVEEGKEEGKNELNRVCDLNNGEKAEMSCKINDGSNIGKVN